MRIVAGSSSTKHARSCKNRTRWMVQLLVSQVFHSRTFETKFTLLRVISREKKAIARFTIDSWCMYLAYVDKLAKDNIEYKIY